VRNDARLADYTLCTNKSEFSMIGDSINSSLSEFLRQ